MGLDYLETLWAGKETVCLDLGTKRYLITCIES